VSIAVRPLRVTVIPYYRRRVTTSGKAAASAAAGALLWGTLGPVAALFDTGDRIAAGGIRLAIGAFVLLAVAKGRPLKRVWRRADLLPLAGGAVGIAGFQLAYFGAIGSAGVAVSTAVGIGLSPVFTGLWTVMTSRRSPGVGWLLGTALALGGLCLLALSQGAIFSLAGLGSSLAGLGLSVLAAAFFSLQAVSIQALTRRHDDATALSGICGAGAVLMIPVIAVTATGNLLTWQGISGVAYLGVVTTGLSYWLFARGIRHIGAAAAVTITLLEPAGAAVIAALFLHENLSAAQWMGIVLIAAAIPIAGRAKETRQPELSLTAAGS
jgi:DME family drug/metabolite transporter